MLFTNITLGTRSIDDAASRIMQELKNHKGKYILQGMIFVMGGVLAAAFPAATALNLELVVGAVLLLTGLFQLALTIRSRMHFWSMLSALLSIGMGILMLWHPLPFLLAFVTLMAVFMTVEGFLELLLAFQFRPVPNWGWMLFSGVITLLLAVLLWIGFPFFDVLYLGWVIAVNFILYGLSLLMLVWHASDMPPLEE